MMLKALPLLVLLPIIAACGFRNATQDERGSPKQMRDLFPPEIKAATPEAGVGPSAAAPAATPSPETASRSPVDSTTWPVTVSAKGVTFRVYQPLPDTWSGDRLSAHALVLAQPDDRQQAVPGTLLMTAQTQVDRGAGVVRLQQLQFPAASFQNPTTTEAWLETLRAALPEKLGAVPLSQLESSMHVVQARQRAAAGAVAVPRILISEKPAVLVYIDGSPRYVPLQGTKLLGVVNTRVLLLKDAAETHYLHLYDGWVKASSLQGPWSVASPPPGVATLEKAAATSGRANLLLGKPGADGRAPSLAAGNLPQIVVGTRPAVLIVLDGPARFAPIPGTALEYASNTSAHLFRDTEANNLYVRVDGNWFRAAALTGPWAHVPLASLPASFAAIPDGHPRRAAAQDRGAGTSAGALSVVSANPQSARLLVTISGDPALQPITGTQLNYVANASVPIIQVDIDNWYAIQNGVWFHSRYATGPWQATDSVPAEIYSIPPSVPIYSAIHSRVLWSSTDVTYYGYPGVGSLPGGGGATGVEVQGEDYQYTPPSSLHWGWFY